MYSRHGCKLCAAAEQVARRVTEGRADLRVENVDDDASLYERYTVRVPVVAVDGREVAEFEVREDDLVAAIDRAAAGRPAG